MYYNSIRSTLSWRHDPHSSQCTTIVLVTFNRNDVWSLTYMHNSCLRWRKLQTQQGFLDAFSLFHSYREKAEIYLSLLLEMNVIQRQKILCISSRTTMHVRLSLQSQPESYPLLPNIKESIKKRTQQLHSHRKRNVTGITGFGGSEAWRKRGDG